MVAMLKVPTSANHHVWKEEELNSSQALVEVMFKASWQVVYGQLVPFDPSMGPVEQEEAVDNKSLDEGLGRTEAKLSGVDQSEEPCYTGWLDRTNRG